MRISLGGMIRRGFLSSEERKELARVARDGSAASSTCSNSRVPDGVASAPNGAERLESPGAVDPIQAGVDSVEHSSFATAETFALMKAHGTYLVPTLTIYDVAYAAAREHPELLAPGTAAKELANDQLPKKNFPLALKSGVKVAYGTDLGEGDHAMEFGLLIQGGMSPMDAIFAATRNAADLIGASDRIGAVAPGHEADIVATDGNPLSDSAQFEHVTFVMKGGVVYRQGRQPTAAGGG